jgi:hypothetical protein
MLRASFAVLLAVTASAAAAQTIEIRPGHYGAPASAEQVRVSLNLSAFIAAPLDGDDALKAQEAGRKMIYEIAGRECALLRDVIANDCRLESVNVNIQRVPANQFGQQKVDGFNINGNIGFRIVPK